MILGGVAITGAMMALLYFNGFFNGERPLDLSENEKSNFLFEMGAARIPDITPQDSPASKEIPLI